MLVALDQVTARPAWTHGAVTHGDPPPLNRPKVALCLEYSDGSADGVAVGAVLRRKVVQTGKPRARAPLSGLDAVADLGSNVLVTRVCGQDDTSPSEIVPRHCLTGRLIVPRLSVADYPKTIRVGCLERLSRWHPASRGSEPQWLFRTR